MDVAGIPYKAIADEFGFSTENQVAVLISNIKNRKRGLTTRFNAWKRERAVLAERYLSDSVSQSQLARERGVTRQAIRIRLGREGVDAEVRDELKHEIKV
ncbi:MAG: hypothetical protein RLZZ283_316 [Candidatus Parcubacteria bacterium]